MKKLIIIAVAVAALAGCKHPAKLRDIGLKGMYVNGYSEVVAIGSGRLTSIPGEREALAAHYSEDTAWLSPATKTHVIDIFLVGTNTVANSKDIISSICNAFATVAPTVSSNNTAVAKGGATAYDLMKSSGEVRKAVDLAKTAAAQAVATAKASSATTASPDSQTEACGDCAAGNCTDQSETK